MSLGHIYIFLRSSNGFLIGVLSTPMRIFLTLCVLSVSAVKINVLYLLDFYQTRIQHRSAAA